MVHYFLECIAFQLVFLVIYEIFLKKETFFQWNRAYLIGTYILSMVLPWIEIKALEINVPENYDIAATGVFQLDAVTLTPDILGQEVFQLSMGMSVLFLGMLVAALIFGYKLYTLHRLKRKGNVHYTIQFTRIVIPQSNLAFSFFKTIFMGDQVNKEDYDQIIAHELVHIKQYHSLDLLFFELMRIISWFNPMVYLYQKRISELHEFIVDSKIAKTDKNAPYQLLLSRVFQTKHISFINPFFKSSLTKKRIVMLQKTASKKVFQLKYALLLPVIFGMLCYTSCNQEFSEDDKEEIQVIEEIGETPITFEISKINSASGQFEEVPFAIVDEVPVFPGCEEATDKRACFNSKVQEHIRKNFRYPEVAQEAGIQGRVGAIFTIGKDGMIANIRNRGPAKVLEEEVSRILMKLPKMLPGKQSGKIVRVPFSIPVTFKLHGTSSTNDPPVIYEQSKETKKFMNLYLELTKERERLLLEVDESSPIIQNLNAEIQSLKKEYTKHFKKNYKKKNPL